MKAKIYQIYYDATSKSHLDPHCIAFDNSSPPRENEFEYGVMRRLYSGSNFVDADLYGVLSWKFFQKFGVQPSSVASYLGSQQDVDVVICNPYPQSDFFDNVWRQGERYHPGMIDIAKEVFELAGISTSMIDLEMRETESYCNYWLANERFLDLYFSFSERVYASIYRNKHLIEPMFEGVQDRYIQAPWFPFIFERLFSTVLTAYRPAFKVLKVKKFG